MSGPRRAPCLSARIRQSTRRVQIPALRFDGKPFRDQSYAGGLTASTFIRAPDFYKSAIRRLCWQYSIVNHRVRSNIVTLDGKEHFVFPTRLKPHAGESEKDAILRHLAMSVGSPVRTEYISHFLWTAGQALVADSYGHNRVVMAGDAVHLFTPQGGFGMNTGVGCRQSGLEAGGACEWLGRTAPLEKLRD